MRSCAALAAIVLIASAVTSARAQAPPEAYREIITAAVEAFSEGRWAEAHESFERAHTLFPNARTLRGMGMCAFEMEHYPEAIRVLDQALRDSRRALTSVQREETLLLIGRARGFVGTFRLVTDPPGAEVRVDGEVPPDAGEGRVLLGVGEHDLQASAPDHHPLRRRLTVGGGEDETIRMVLVPAALGDPPEAAVGFFLAGAATLLIEPIFVGWWVDRDSEVASCASPPDGFRCTNVDLLEEQRAVALGSSVAIGVAALGLAAVGLVLWLVSGSDRASGSSACGAGPGIMCRF